ncbi:TRAP transporter large permease [Oceanobacillus salinisoli]|uniref:TRAP transporter large permease n=1 Tax=Oceanobacillus salinisoli TaxID=2678611 RepID=UPI0022AFE663|nr:TRAP transporter large permease subunit [Oceanobacillus salinisoli]
MLLLMICRIPIFISMLIPTFIGIFYIRGWDALASVIEQVVWNQSHNYILTTIPMFILMGQLIYLSGISEELFNMFRNLFHGLKGNLAISTIGASALFAASTGSSVATTGTIGVLASKEMVSHGYNKALSSGSIVAGGTLGILIPPSTMFIVYGTLTEQSIGKLFIAGIIPGILLTLLFILTIYIAILIKPQLAPISDENEKVSLKQRFMYVKSSLWVIILFVIVIGGMYVGLFTPTEAAGVGALGALIIALIRKRMTWNLLFKSLAETLKTTGFIFAILIAAFCMNYFMSITNIPILLSDYFNNTNLSPILILILLILMYIVLGAIMDSNAIIVITIPIVLPLIVSLGYDLIWFGVLVTLVVEMALITPPVGLNCFVLNGVVPSFKLETIFKGAFLFVIPIVALIALLIIFPEIALYLPNNMD